MTQLRLSASGCSTGKGLSLRHAELFIAIVRGVGHRVVAFVDTSPVWYGVVPLLYIGLLLWFGHAWLGQGIPEGDLAGAASDLARWSSFAQSGLLFAGWDDTSFLGHPRSLANLYSGMALAYAPFLVFFDPLMAVKIGSLIYLALAGFSAAVLVRAMTGYATVGLIMGVAYALHPIHLSLTIGSSHANFPPYYAIQPLLVLSALCIAKKPSVLWQLGFAIALALAAWLDLERTAVLAPGLLVFIGVLLFSRLWIAGFAKVAVINTLAALGRGVSSTLLAFGVLAFLWMPAVADRSLHALFDEQLRESSREFFSIRNPLYYIDRNGRLFPNVYDHLPAELAHDAGHFYLGWVLLLLAGVPLVVRQRGRRAVWLWAGAMLSLACVLAAGHGSYSGWDSLGQIVDEVWLYEDTRGAVAWVFSFLAAAIIAVVGVWLLLRIRLRPTPRQQGALWIGGAVACILIWARPYPWLLSYAPVLNEIRNPGWFATALPPLALVIAAGLGMATLFRATRQALLRALITVACLILVLWDASAYQGAFDRQSDPSVQQELMIIGEVMQADPVEGRFLTRESYNPEMDLLYAYSGRDTAWYWLNWMAPLETSRLFLEDIYPRLHHPDTIADALDAAGRANVRYLVYDLRQGPPPPATEALNVRFAGEYIALYENMRCLSAIRWGDVGNPLGIDGDRPLPSMIQSMVDRSEPGHLKVEVIASDPDVLCFAYSWTPRWTALVDGKKVPIIKTDSAMIGIELTKGRHEVELVYEAGRAVQAGVVVSGTTLAMIGVILTGVTWRKYRINCAGGDSCEN